MEILLPGEVALDENDMALIAQLLEQHITQTNKTLYKINHILKEGEE